MTDEINVQGMYIGGERNFSTIQAQNNRVVEKITQLKNTKDYENYSNLEFEINFLDNMIAEKWNIVSNKKVVFEENKAELKATKEGLLPEYRKKDGVNSNDVAKALIEKDYEPETLAMAEAQKIITSEVLEMEMYDRYLRGAIRIANHMKDWFYRESEMVKRVSTS